MKRTDYNGPRPPEHLAHALYRIGGVNPFGLANYRLVHGSARFAPSGGRWFDWNKNLSVGERREDRNSPIRTVVETRMALRYMTAKDKWVLEKWGGAENYGTPKQWYLPQSQGGTMVFYPEVLKYVPAVGEYPFEGDYENLGYAFPTEALTIPVIETAVNRFVQGLEQMPMSPSARVQRACYQAEQIEATTREAERRLNLDILNETDYAFGGASFVSQSAPKRSHSMNADALKAGIRSHTGRS